MDAGPIKLEGMISETETEAPGTAFPKAPVRLVVTEIHVSGPSGTIVEFTRLGEISHHHLKARCKDVIRFFIQIQIQIHVFTIVYNYCYTILISNVIFFISAPAPISKRNEQDKFRR